MTSPWLFFVLFAAAWVLVVSIFTQISGWPALADRYARPRNERPSARAYLQGMVLRPGGIGYNGCVNIGASERGLFLFVLPPFQFGQPELMIPWDGIRPLGREWYWLFPYEWYAFDGGERRVGFPVWSWGAKVVRRYAPPVNADVAR